MMLNLRMRGVVLQEVWSVAHLSSPPAAKCCLKIEEMPVHSSNYNNKHVLPIVLLELARVMLQMLLEYREEQAQLLSDE